jgi:hypothetical protein
MTSAPQHAPLRDEGRVYDYSQLFEMVDDDDDGDGLQDVSGSPKAELVRDRGRLSFQELLARADAGLAKAAAAAPPTGIAMLVGRLDERKGKESTKRSEERAPSRGAERPSFAPLVDLERQTESPSAIRSVPAPKLTSRDATPSHGPLPVPSPAPSHGLLNGSTTSPTAPVLPANSSGTVSKENRPPVGILSARASQSNGVPSLPPPAKSQRVPHALDSTTHRTPTELNSKPTHQFVHGAQSARYGQDGNRPFVASKWTLLAENRRASPRSRLRNMPSNPPNTTPPGVPPARNGLAHTAHQSIPNGLPPRHTYIIDLTQDDSDSDSQQSIADSSKRRPLLESHRTASYLINPRNSATTNGVHPPSAVESPPSVAPMEHPPEVRSEGRQTLGDFLNSVERSDRGLREDLQSRAATPPFTEPRMPPMTVSKTVADRKTLSTADRKRIVLNAFHRYKLPTESKFTPGPNKERNPKAASQPKGKGPLKRELPQLPPVYPPLNTALSQFPNSLPSSTPNFDTSCLPPKEAGAAHSDVEKLMLIYLFEEKQFPRRVIDKMLGRKYKNGSGCYAKWHQSLRNPRVRKALDLDRNMTALKQIMKLDWPILATCKALEAFLVSGVLPAGLKLPPNPTWETLVSPHPTMALAFQLHAPAQSPTPTSVQQRQTVVQSFPRPSPRLRIVTGVQSAKTTVPSVPSPLSLPQSYILANHRRKSGSILREDANDLRETESARLAGKKVHGQTPDRSRAATDDERDEYDMLMIAAYRGQKRES